MVKVIGCEYEDVDRCVRCVSKLRPFQQVLDYPSVCIDIKHLTLLLTPLWRQQVAPACVESPASAHARAIQHLFDCSALFLRNASLQAADRYHHLSFFTAPSETKKWITVQIGVGEYTHHRPYPYQK